MSDNIGVLLRMPIPRSAWFGRSVTRPRTVRARSLCIFETRSRRGYEICYASVASECRRSLLQKNAERGDGVRLRIAAEITNCRVLSTRAQHVKEMIPALGFREVRIGTLASDMRR
jgi:hypothetical protein